MSQARFGVPHGRRRIAVHGPEVPLTFDQGVSHGPWLRHVHQRGVDSHVAVRMVVTHRFTDDLGALAMFPVRLEPETVHGVENSPLRRLSTRLWHPEALAK